MAPALINKKQVCDIVTELKILNESLHKENIAKDREIRQLIKDAQQYEQTVLNLRNEMSLVNYVVPGAGEVCTKDAAVMARMCCTGTECGDWEPVKDFSEMLSVETMKYQERIQEMEAKLKVSSAEVRALRKLNVSLSDELRALRRAVTALHEHARDAARHDQLKDEILREMRKQLKLAKAKVSTSTPNATRTVEVQCTSEPDVSIIERSVSAPIFVSDTSIEDLQNKLQRCSLNDTSSSSSSTASPGTSYYWKRPDIKERSRCKCGKNKTNCDCEEEKPSCSNNQRKIVENINVTVSPGTSKEPGERNKNVRNTEGSDQQQKVKKELRKDTLTDVNDKIYEDTKLSPCKTKWKQENDNTSKIVEDGKAHSSKDYKESPKNIIRSKESSQHKETPLNSVHSYIDELYSTAVSKSPEDSETESCFRPEEIMKTSKKMIKKSATKEVEYDAKIEDKCEVCGDPLSSSVNRITCKCAKEIMKAYNIKKTTNPGFENCPCPPEVLKCSAKKKQKTEKVECQCAETSIKTEDTKSEAGSTLMKLVKDLPMSFGMTKDSGGVCSLADSSNCTCDASARAQYYSNKLMSTLQIVQNKEETIRVQAESLSVAEARITALTDRSAELRRELDRKNRELQCLRQTLDSYKVEKADVCVSVDRQETGIQSDVVSTLQNNLSIIEELYRECFYETAKQEDLIDMLRNSYLDVRLMEKKKTDQIGRMQTVIDTQKWSLEKCQDIALEVDNLKMEISNFLSSSTSSTNNDSGVWERSEECLAPGVHEDLQEIMAKLFTLQDMLDSGCVCGLEQENIRLKEDNETLQNKVSELSDRISELQGVLGDKDNVARKYEQVIQHKDEEMHSIRQQIADLQKSTNDQSTSCDTLSAQLDQVVEKLDAKTCELQLLRQQCETHEETDKQLREELRRAEEMVKENWSLQSFVRELTSQVSSCRAQLWREQQQRELSHRESAAAVCGLRAELRHAQAHGEALCARARGALRDVRGWAGRAREQHREQERLLQEKEILIRSLQHRVRKSETQRPCDIEITPSCSKYQSSQPSCSNYQPTCSKCESCRQPSSSKLGQRIACSPSASETASRSSAPIPMKRVLRKKSSACTERRKPCCCEASVHQPDAEDHCSGTCSPLYPQHGVVFSGGRVHRTTGDVSPTDELLLRMEKVTAAFEDGHRRWSKPRDQR